MTDALFARAVDCAQRGDLRMCGHVLDELLRQNPAHVEGGRLAAKLMLAQGNAAAGRDRLAALARHHPAHEDLAFEAGVASIQAGDYGGAEEWFRAHLAAFPDHAGSLFNLAWLMRQRGADAEAVALLSRLVQLQPGHGDAWFNLGNSLAALGRSAEAVTAFSTALARGAARDPVLVNLALAHLRLGQVEDAEGIHRQLGAVAETTQDGLALSAELAEAKGDCERALAFYDRACAMAGAGPSIRLGRILLLSRMGRSGQVVDELMPLLAEAAAPPALMLALCDAALALRRLDVAERAARSALAGGSADVAAVNALGRVLALKGDSAGALACFRDGLARDPDVFRVHSNLIYGMLHDDSSSPEQVFAEARAFGRRWESRFDPLPPVPLDGADPDQVLRIGYVSPDFCEHAVTFLFEPLLTGHDRSRFEITCYHHPRRRDPVTARLRAAADRWRELDGEDFPDMARRVREDGIHVLVDLAGHTNGNLLPLFALQPAPVQMSAIGYPGTTGLERIQYRFYYGGAPKLSDDPCYSSEMLVTPSCPLPFSPLRHLDSVGPPPFLMRGYVTFGALNRLSKVGAKVQECWGRILAALPSARLLLVAGDGLSAPDIRALFTRHGAAPEQIEIVGEQPLEGWLELMERVDVMLDTFPYGGGTTSLFADLRGVPVVTMRPPGHYLDQTRRLYCGSEDEYVQTAVALAGNPLELTERRAELPAVAALQEGLTARLAAREFERIYRWAWRRHLAAEV